MPENRRFAFLPQVTTHSKELNSLPVTARWLDTVMVAERGGLQKPFEFPYSAMENITGFARTTISRAIKALDNAGFLEYEHGGLERNSNLYQLEESKLQI